MLINRYVIKHTFQEEYTREQKRTHYNIRTRVCNAYVKNGKAAGQGEIEERIERQAACTAHFPANKR